MATKYANKNIISDGLIFIADPKNARNNDNHVINFKTGATGSFNNGADRDVNKQTWTFDNVDDHIDYGSNAIGTTYTFDIWFRLGASGNNIAIGSGVNTYMFYMNGLSTMFHNRGGSFDSISVDGPLELNVWYNFTSVRNNGLTEDVYKNGEFLGTMDFSINPSFNFRYIGMEQPSGVKWDGDISEIKVYNRVLSQSEIIQNYKANKHRFENEILDGLVLNMSSRTGVISGTAWSDLSASQNNGVLNNGVDFDGTDMDFDGADDYVDFGDILNSSLDTEFTVCSWVKFSNVSTYNAIITKWQHSTQDSWYFEKTNNDGGGISVGVASSITDNGGNRGTAVLSLSNDVWYNVCFVYDGGGAANSDRLKIYLDSDDKSISFTGTIPSSLTNATSTLRMGSFTGGVITRIMNGKIPTLKIYNRVLSPLEITQEYNATKHRFRNI